MLELLTFVSCLTNIVAVDLEFYKKFDECHTEI
jgi:hypothetical protein